MMWQTIALGRAFVGDGKKIDGTGTVVSGGMKMRPFIAAKEMILVFKGVVLLVSMIAFSISALILCC